MKISSGKIAKAQKVVIYGAEGIGKSTLASKFPEPLFIDIEESTYQMDVKRLDKPSSWQMLLEQVEWVKSQDFKTIVIDTTDWAEKLCKDFLLAKNPSWKVIDSANYGVKYVALSDEWGKLLNKLSEITANGINVVLLAHAQMRKFERPDEMGAYDRWELKLEKRSANITKEWADMILFLNYKTIVIQNDKKAKAQGQERVMYATHNAVWDAKNRHGLPDEMEMSYDSIAHVFYTDLTPKKPTIEETFPDIIKEINDIDMVNPFLEKPEVIPQELWDLMLKDNVSIEQLQKVTESQGIAPKGTEINKYDINYLKYVASEWLSFKKLLNNI